MDQRISCRFKYKALDYLFSGAKDILPFLLAACLCLFPLIVNATCAPTSPESWYTSICTTEGECSNLLNGVSGADIWSYNLPGEDCQCWWQTCDTYPCPYVICDCCMFSVPSPSPCASSDPCCGDPTCGNPPPPPPPDNTPPTSPGGGSSPSQAGGPPGETSR